MDLFSFKPQPAAPKALSVTQLLRRMKNLLEVQLGEVWVEGEVSNLRKQGSGHWYFSLKDEAAQIQCVMFGAGRKPGAEVLLDGALVRVFAEASVYEARGQLQIIVAKAERAGLGELQARFDALKRKLQAEGLFEAARKRPIPAFPAVVGIVTSDTGAAIRDILNVLQRRAPWVQPVLFPVRVQGKGAELEIAEAIRKLGRAADFGYPRCDVLIVGRGGGSLEDLWAFNEEVVARAIYDSEIPVISAVGHEIDYTIADFVADLRAPTPSAAAELVIPRKEDLVNSISTNTVRLKNALLNILGTMTQRLTKLSQSYALKQPLKMVEQYEQMIDDLRKDMAIRISHLVKLNSDHHNLLAEKLAVLSPLSILNRGYSISSRLPEMKIIKDAGDIKVGDRIETRLGRGTFISKIEEIN